MWIKERKNRDHSGFQIDVVLSTGAGNATESVVYQVNSIKMVEIWIMLRDND
jgi:hypothetical protein